MKNLRRHSVLVLVGAIFALFLGLNVFSYACHCEARKTQAVERLNSVDFALPTPLLNAQTPAHQQFSRPNGYTPLDGATRNLQKAFELKTFKSRAFLPAQSRIPYPAPVTYKTPKAYYVYTLRRILC